MTTILWWKWDQRNAFLCSYFHHNLMMHGRSSGGGDFSLLLPFLRSSHSHCSLPLPTPRPSRTETTQHKQNPPAVTPWCSSCTYNLTFLPIASLLLRVWIFRNSQVAAAQKRVCSFEPSVINMWSTMKSPHKHREGPTPSQVRKTSMELAGYPFWGSGAVLWPDTALGLRVLPCCYFFICRNVCDINIIYVK